MPCRSLTFTAYPAVPPSVPLQKESSWSHPDFTPPIRHSDSADRIRLQEPEVRGTRAVLSVLADRRAVSLAVYSATNGIRAGVIRC